MAQLDDIARVFAELGASSAGTGDLALDFTDASIHKLAVLLTREGRATGGWKLRSDGASLLAQVVIHGAVYVGATIDGADSGFNGRFEARCGSRSCGWSRKAGTADLPVFRTGG
ncbi:MAG: hypothetical protein R3F14_14975 [Polyangiaceae bacterium]